VIQQQHQRRNRGGGVGFALPGDIGGGTVDGFKHRGESPVGIDVSRGRQPDTTGDGPGLVCQNIAKEVIGNDHVETTGISYQENRGGVDVQVIHFYLGVFPRYFLDAATPQVPGVNQDVVFMHVGQFVAPGPGLFKGIANHAFDTVTSIHRNLGRDLLGSTLSHHTAVTAIQALGTFAHHHEVHVTGIRQRGGHSRIVLGRPQVHIVVKGETQLQQQPALQHARRHRGVPNRAQQDRVVSPQCRQGFIIQNDPVAVPTRRSQVISRGFQLNPGLIQDFLQHLHGFGDDFASDAVPWNQRQINLAHVFSFN